MAEYHIQPIVLQTEAVALTPLNASPREWITCVLTDFDAFLQDHASAEKSLWYGTKHGVALPR